MCAVGGFTVRCVSVCGMCGVYLGIYVGGVCVCDVFLWFELWCLWTCCMLGVC